MPQIVFNFVRSKKCIIMKFNQFRFIIPLFAIILLNSCLGTNDPTTYSENPTFVSLKFAANDSIPNLEDAVFSLQFDALLNDSVIINLDSLPYQTRIDSVFPTFSFKSTAGSMLYFQNGDSVGITGKDTIDFTQVVAIKNTAAAEIHPRTYKIKVNVHQVEAELYVWNKVNNDLDSHNAVHQKAVILNDKLFYYLSDNTTGYLYNSVDGYSWDPKTVNGLPINTPLNDMSQFNGKLYLSNNNDKIYSTSDGYNWTEKTYTDYNFKSLLFVLNDSLRAITQSKTDLKYRFASSKDGGTWIVREKDEIPANFPISEFTALSFYSRSGKQKGIIVGGKDINGNVVTSNWSSEAKIQNGKTYWVDFSLENHTLDTLAIGSSVIHYDDKLYLLGVRNDKPIFENYYKVSIDEGLSWQTADTINNVLPESFSPRNFQSAVVLKPTKFSSSAIYTKTELINSNRIFIIGGKTQTGVLSDIWSGKLNRKSFFRQ